MTPRERVLAALAGEMPDKVPMVVWNNKLADADITRRLLEREVCIVNKSTVYTWETPEIEVETKHLEPVDGAPRVQRIYHTAAG